MSDKAKKKPKGKETEPKLNFLAFRRIFYVLIAVLLMVPVAFVLQFILPRCWWVVPRFFHRTLCKILGININIKGQVYTQRSVLFVSNHVSWKDILVLGGVLKKASFVSKAEVGSNPISRMMAGLHKTLYVKRSKKSDAKRQSEEMAGRIKSGDSLILFPEGTTTRGVHVQKFKTALFSVAEVIIKAGHQDLPVQPVTLSYTHTNRLPILRSKRIQVGWIGQVKFWPHLKYALCRRSTQVTIEFHKPIMCDEDISRKQLAAQCEEIIAEGLSQSHRNRG